MIGSWVPAAWLKVEFYWRLTIAERAGIGMLLVASRAFFVGQTRVRSTWRQYVIRHAGHAKRLSHSVLRGRENPLGTFKRVYGINNLWPVPRN